MSAVDLIAVATIAAFAAWGFTRGFERALVFLAFGTGAVLGTRVPLLVVGDLDASYSLAVALPAALVLGGALAAVAERFVEPIARPIARRAATDALAGALVAALLGAVAVWILAPVATEVRSLREPVRDSALLARLNAVLTPAGPAPTNTKTAPIDNLPVASGRVPNIKAGDARAETDPDVRRAARSTRAGYADQRGGAIAATTS